MNAERTKKSQKYWLLAIVILFVIAATLFLLIHKQPRVTVESNTTLTSETSTQPSPPVASSLTKEAALNTASTAKKGKASKLPQPTETELNRARYDAKLTLSAFFVGEKSFYSEYKRYTTDIVELGWQPGDPMSFKAGFFAPFTPAKFADSKELKEEPRRLNTDSLIGIKGEDGKEPYAYTATAAPIRFEDYEHYCQHHCSADAESFEILVVVPLGNTGRVDVWSIDSAKRLTQVKDRTKD